MRGFTATGQPRQGGRYTVTQGDLVIPVTVVGKLYGRGGNADLIGVILEGPEGRATVDWPIEAADGTDPIRFTAGWDSPEDES